MKVFFEQISRARNIDWIVSGVSGTAGFFTFAWSFINWLKGADLTIPLILFILIVSMVNLLKISMLTRIVKRNDQKIDIDQQSVDSKNIHLISNDGKVIIRKIIKGRFDSLIDKSFRVMTGIEMHIIMKDNEDIKRHAINTVKSDIRTASAFANNIRFAIDKNVSMNKKLLSRYMADLYVIMSGVVSALKVFQPNVEMRKNDADLFLEMELEWNEIKKEIEELRHNPSWLDLDSAIDSPVTSFHEFNY